MGLSSTETYTLPQPVVLPADVTEWKGVAMGSLRGTGLPATPPSTLCRSTLSVHFVDPLLTMARHFRFRASQIMVKKPKQGASDVRPCAVEVRQYAAEVH